MYIFNDLFNSLDGLFEVDNDLRYRRIPADVLQTADGYEVIAELPGISKENVKINYEDGILTIEATNTKSEGNFLLNERSVLNFKRTLDFGDIEEEQIKAKMENGLLVINIIVKKPEEKIKREIIIE